MGALAFSPACGDDKGSDTGNSSDQFPTAGPCAHDPNSPECEATGTGTVDTGGTATMGMTDDTGSATDVFPTTPCAHDPNAPGCGSSSGSDSGTDTDSDTDTDTDTDSASTGTGTSTSG